MGYGIGGFLGLAKQNSFGTATTAAGSFEYLPIISESISTNIEELLEESIQRRYDEGDSHEGLQSVSGDVVFEPHPLVFGRFLQGVLGQCSSTLVGSVYTHVFEGRHADFDTNCALPPYTFQVHRDNGQSWQMTDVVVNNLSMELAAGGMLRATANVMGRVSSLMAAPTPTFADDKPWKWYQGSFSLAGAANSDLENITFNIENGVEGVAFVDTQKVHGKLKRTGYRNLGISGGLDFSVQSEYMKFRASSEQPLALTLTGDTITTSQTNLVTISAGKFRYTSFPTGLSGPGRVSVSFEGKAKYHSGSASALRVTLVNTHAPY